MSLFLFETFSSRPEIVWIHTAADFFAAFSYYLLCFLFLRFVYARKDLSARKRLIFIGSFFFFAGTVHVFNLWAPWYPVYSLQILARLIAALSALVSVIFLWRILPKALALPGPRKIEELMDRIVHEQEAQKRAHQEKKSLENLIEKKNKDLAQCVKALELEKEESMRIEGILSETEKSIRSLADVMTTIEGARDFYTALETAVRKICETAGCDYGETWIPRSDGKVLECMSAWYQNEDFAELFQIVRELKFPPNMGLPGRAWISHEPLTIEEISKSSSKEFFGLETIWDKGLRSALAVPVMVEGKVVAVLTFYTLLLSQRLGPLKDWVMDAVKGLSSVIQRQRLEERIIDVEKMIERRVQEKMDALEKSNLGLQRAMEECLRTEESIKKSQENFHTLVNSIEGIVWEYDLLNSRYTFVSQQTEKILGYPASSWLSDPTFWQDHVHGADREMAMAFREKAAHDGRNEQLEYRMVSAEGKTLWLRDMMSTVVEEAKTVTLRGVMVDITGRKEAEAAWHDERNFVSAVLDTASALVMILDAEGCIVRMNLACEKLSGYKEQEVKGKLFWDLPPSEEIPAVKSVFRRLLAGQFPANYESSWIAKDGTRRDIAWSNTLLSGKVSGTTHIIATGVDITKRKEIEKKLHQAVQELALNNQELDKYSAQVQEANERLKKLDELKSRFISAASHELKTPLTSLKGYVEMVLNGEAGAINEEQKEYLRYVKESTDRLHRLLRELLDISKIESGQAKMHRDRTDLRVLTKEEMTLFKAQAQEKGIALVMNVEADLNQIFCDADKIREVMDNLLSNAIKYTPSGGRVKIFARNLENRVEIGVEDTGIGIKKEDQQRIFDPFQHIEKNGMAEREESTGLGLTLVKRIVEAHGGEIHVESREGKGTTFTALLPLDMKEKKLNELIGHDL